MVITAASASPEPQLEYTLHFNPADTSAISVELRVTNAPARMQLAAHAHPEYDDKYWRYVEDIRASTRAGRLTVENVDSVRWQLDNGPGDVTITYRMKFPFESRPRAGWQPFLAPTGALIGGPHSFLYVIGLEKSPASVKLDIPAGWKVATGLEGKSTARNFVAPNIHTLMESPLLVGPMSEWTFTAGKKPHRVFYWRLPNSTPFDSTEFVSGIEKLTRQTIDLFGGAPYREYSFLFQDGAFAGGLEHPNSVTLGAPSEQLAKDPHFTLGEVAHEFVHTWNLMAIKPVTYREVDYRAQPPVSELWFSEGLTIFYADLLRRRAGLPVEDSTRIAHIERLITRYHNQPGIARYSAERVSQVEYNAPPDALGDYFVSSHVYGEIIGTLLDLLIRHATDGARSMDDAMRLMYARFSGKKFTSRDVQRVVEDVCKCSAAPVFERHVFNAGAVDFNRHLAPLGLRAEVTWAPAKNNDGTPAKDLRASAWLERGDTLLRLRVTDPNSVWGRAGLHTGDRIVTVNGKETRTWPEFRSFLTSFAIGDSATLVVQRNDRMVTTRVVMAGLNRPTVRVTGIPGSSSREERLRSAWLRGDATASRRELSQLAARPLP